MQPMNVSEIYPLYDSVIISQRLWGNEPKVKGWFGGHEGDRWARPFEMFSQAPEHIFFKDRTEGSTHLAYCNLQSAERMDFAYRLYSIGVRFWGPISAFEVSPRIQHDGDGMLPWGTALGDDPFALLSTLGHQWKSEIPRHTSFEFKVEQDVIAEGPCMAFPPGHGFTGGGSAWSGPVTPGVVYDDTLKTAFDQNIDADTAGEDSIVQQPQHISVINQGCPVLGNRFNFTNSAGEPQPIEIPRGALFQASIKLTPYASYMLSETMGPLYYMFNRICPRESYYTIGEDSTIQVDPATWFGTRYGITVSMLGERLVQQRGQYHAPETD